MSFVIGFGIVEEQEREKVRAMLCDGHSADEIEAEYNPKADEYDKMPRETAPERYTRLYIYGGKIRYHHINRRHALSPDGWALCIIEEPLQQEPKR